MEEQLELFGKVTVKSLQPIYTIKDNVEANSIELLKMEENDFDLIVGKGLYHVRQELIYIYPDTNLKEGNDYLESYINPTDKDGKPISSKLGSKNRVKAIGFNFHKGDFKKLYSNGIVCPINSNVESYLCKIESEFSESLKATGGKVFPSFLYKTDETNYKKLANTIEYPITLVGTMKSDGSSLSVFVKDNESGICSRNLLKPLVHQKQVGIKYKIPFANFLKKYFKLPKWCSEPIYQNVDSTDDFVKYGKPYLNNIDSAYNDITWGISESFKLEDGQEGLCLRFELCGETAKGSGNKNNPHAKKKTGLECFGLDYIINGKAVKQPYETYKTFCDTYGIPRVEVIIEPTTFKSKEQLEEVCEDIFKKRMFEGIVLRTLDSQFSCKMMSDAYDAKK